MKNRGSYRQRLSLAATRDECEALRLDGDASLLYVLLNVPETKGNRHQKSVQVQDDDLKSSNDIMLITITTTLL